MKNRMDGKTSTLLLEDGTAIIIKPVEEMDHLVWVQTYRKYKGWTVPTAQPLEFYLNPKTAEEEAGFIFDRETKPYFLSEFTSNARRAVSV